MTTVDENLIANSVPACRALVVEAAAGPVRRFERVLSVIEPCGLRNPMNSALLRHLQSAVGSFKRSKLTPTVKEYVALESVAFGEAGGLGTLHSALKRQLSEVRDGLGASRKRRRLHKAMAELAALIETASNEYERRRGGVAFAGVVFAMEFARERMVEFRAALQEARDGVPAEFAAPASCHHHELTDKVYRLKTHLSETLRSLPRRLDALTDEPSVAGVTVATMRSVIAAWQEELESAAAELRTMLGL